MGNLRQYQTYYCVDLDHHSEDWGGETYSKIMVKEFPNKYLSTTSYTTGGNAKFLYPTIVMNKYYLDGIAEGYVSIHNTDSSSHDLNSYTVYLKKSDEVTETILGTYTQSFSSPETVAADGWLTLPVYMNIDKKLVEEDEKLILELDHSDDTDLAWAHANDRDVVDMQIKIPFAPTG